MTHMACRSLNSPTRSSNAIYESVWIDDGKPFADKQLTRAYLASYPLAASTALTLSVAIDYSSSYTQVNRPDDSIFNTLNGLFGFFKPVAFNDKKAFKVKVQATSSSSSGPKLQAIGLRYFVKDNA